MLAPTQDDWQNDARTIIEMGRTLKKARDEFHGSTADFTKKIFITHGISESSVGKLIKIANHPILGDLNNANKLPPSWAILYELKFMPDEWLTEQLNKDALRHISKYDVWAARGVRANKNPVSQGGVIRVPNDISLVDYVRSGMAKETDPNGSEIPSIAKELGLGVATYRMVRALIHLAERDDLEKKDREILFRSLDRINRTRNVRPSYEEVRPIIEKVFGDQRNKKFTTEASQKRVEAYLNAIIILGVNTQRLIDQEIPFMSVADTDKAITELAEIGRVVRKTAENLRRARNG